MKARESGSLASSVRGCWLGKNIGGTLGEPFESRTEVQDVEFYVQKDLNGNPRPNDDLDLQLVWLTLAEHYGIRGLTPRLLGEYWIGNIIGPWNEYAACRRNCREGFYPPLSGAVDNDVWKWSNGAWIRSEIWACLFPGDPDRAIEFAYLDACCDHAGEGIYAEMFTAALESAAFVEKDLRRLVRIALAKVPDDSRLRESVLLACRCFDSGLTWREARDKVVELNRPLGWFQAPANVSFAIIGLLFGRGDFGRTICIATNCGDDTDCTAAMAGAVMGILAGAEGIPEKWRSPIGDNILTVAINPFGLPRPVPRTVTELTARVLALGELIRAQHPRTPPEDLASREVAERLWRRSPYELRFGLSRATIGVEYLEGPWIEPGRSCHLKIWVHSPVAAMPVFRFVWRLPEGWTSSQNGTRCAISHMSPDGFALSEVTPPEDIPDSMSYLQLDVHEDQRSCPETLNVPFRRKGSFFIPQCTSQVRDRLWI